METAHAPHGYDQALTQPSQRINMAENNITSQEQTNELQSLKEQASAQERVIVQMAEAMQEMTQRLSALAESHTRQGEQILTIAQLLEKMQ